MMDSRHSICCACGSQMAPCLVRAASPRCHDCRDSHAPLRADLVEAGLVLPFPARPKPESDLRRAA
jgi:hypothetical protein